MEIKIIMLNGTCRTMAVNPEDTVGSLKLRIQSELGVAPERQKLIFDNGQRKTLSDDSQNLGSYGLHSGCQLSLLIIEPATIQVFLKNEKGIQKTYDITADETVSNFKKRVHKLEGVPESQQRLIHESKEMSEGKLSDYGVKQHSTIYLMLRLRGG